MARIDTLGHFLTDVADAIRTKTGSSDTIQASDFDTEIENIPGTVEAKNVSDIDTIYLQTIQDVDNYLYNAPNSYSGYTNSAVTLYTPSADNQKYIVRKNKNTQKYQILWFADNVFISRQLGGFGFTASQMNAQTAYITNMHYISTLEYYKIISGGYTSTFYQSSGYDTIEDVVLAIQSSETVYTSGSNAGFNCTEYSSEYYFPFTNMPVSIRDTSQSSTIETTDIHQRKISTNETINVINQ